MNAGGQTIRGRILGVIEAATRPLTGQEIAALVGMPYKPTIDALNALYNYGKVRRTGAKFTARWSAVRPVEPSPLALLRWA